MTAPHVTDARIRVPGSTSNLGSGFDTIGLALDRYLDATFTPDDSGYVQVERGGTLERLADFPGPDLVAETFEDGIRAAGAVPSGRLLLHSTIPVVRGFGSSAAAVLAGHELVQAALGRPPDPEGAFRAALAREGHGDNAAPSLYGGLRGVVPGVDGPRILQLRLSDRLAFAYAAPAQVLSTKEARAALPGRVDHATAVTTLGRLTALLEGLATADPELLRVGFEDDLHVPYRLPLIPGAREAIEAGYQAGAWGVTISGGGSGLIAVCAEDRAPRVAEAMRAVFLAEADDQLECVGFAAVPDLSGLRRE